MVFEWKSPFFEFYIYSVEQMNLIYKQGRTALQDQMDIDKSHGKLDLLERKMNSYFQKHQKQDSPRLITEEPYPSYDLNSPQDYQHLVTQNKKTSNHGSFKIFNHNIKKQKNSNQQDIPTKIQTKQRSTSCKKQKVYEPDTKIKKNMSDVETFIEEVQIMEILIKKKLALKEEKLIELETQMKRQNQQKIRLYKINEELEKELEELENKFQFENQKDHEEMQILEKEDKYYKKELEKAKKQNKLLQKQEELLRDTLKNVHKARKGQIEKDLRKNSSKSFIKPPQSNKDIEEEVNLRNLVRELDKLKIAVKNKMKKSTSRSKIR